MFEDQESYQGKLAQTSERFRKLFLLVFTRELIKQSKIEEFFKLDQILKRRDKAREGLEKTKEIEEKPKKPEEKFFLSLMHREPFNKREERIDSQLFKPLPKTTATQSQAKTPYQQIKHAVSPRIPEYPLPPNLQNLHPTPINVPMDLGKLNPFINNPGIKSIECNGPEESIIVKGNMGAKTTNIMLSTEEINQILQRFSDISKIPLHEGIFKIVVGKLILSAIISEVVGSKFIIRKMAPQLPAPGFGYHRFY